MMGHFTKHQRLHLVLCIQSSQHSGGHHQNTVSKHHHIRSRRFQQPYHRNSNFPIQQWFVGHDFQNHTLEIVFYRRIVIEQIVLFQLRQVLVGIQTMLMTQGSQFVVLEGIRIMLQQSHGPKGILVHDRGFEIVPNQVQRNIKLSTTGSHQRHLIGIFPLHRLLQFRHKLQSARCPFFQFQFVTPKIMGFYVPRDIQEIRNRFLRHRPATSHPQQA